MVPTKILISTTVSTLIINQHIRMISEKSVLHSRDKLYFKVYQNKKLMLEIAIIFHNITVFFSIFDQINTAYLSQAYLSQSFEQKCTYKCFIFKVFC